MKAALRRVYAPCPSAKVADGLWARHGDGGELARAVPAGPWDGRRPDFFRIRGPHRDDEELHGGEGGMELPRGPGPLSDLPAASTWLHLGKAYRVGLGPLRLLPPAAAADAVSVAASPPPAGLVANLLQVDDLGQFELWWDPASDRPEPQHRREVPGPPVYLRRRPFHSGGSCR